MKKIVLATMFTIILSGCGEIDRNVAKLSGNAKSCVDGLVVLQMTSGAFYQRTPDDKLVRC